MRKTLPAIFCSIGLATLLICAEFVGFSAVRFSLRAAPWASDPRLRRFGHLVYFSAGGREPRLFWRANMTMNGLIQFEAIDVLFVLLATIAWAFLLGGLLTRNRTSGGESARAAWFRRVSLTPTFFKDVLRRAMLRKMSKTHSSGWNTGARGAAARGGPLSRRWCWPRVTCY